MTPAQCRAARGLLDWSQQQLADASKVGNATIRNFEAGRSSPRHATLDVLRRAFEKAGVFFVEENGEGPGVRLRERIPAPVMTMLDFGLIVFRFEQKELARIQSEFGARPLLLERRFDRINLKENGSSGPIGFIRLEDGSVVFEPDIERDGISHE